MPAESHTILDGKVHVYRHENSRYWQCAAYLGGRNHRRTTGQTSLALAFDFAREWYMDRFAEERLRRRGLGPAQAVERPPASRAPPERGRAAKAAGPTFREAADAFLAEYQVITFGERSELHVKRMADLLILEIEVRGKRGVGYCKSTPGAVIPFQRLRKRSSPEPADLIFGTVQRELLNAVLTELGLKRDRDGNPRTAYSLRHTYICMRLMEGADIYQIAKNCRTSVEMIETFYASHIKNAPDASAINVRKKPKARKAPSAHRAQVNA